MVLDHVTDNVIIGIILSPARAPGPKQNDCSVTSSRVRGIFSYSKYNLHHMTDKHIQSPRSQCTALPEWWVQLAVHTSVGKRLHTLPSHQTLLEPQRFICGTLTPPHLPPTNKTKLYCVRAIQTYKGLKRTLFIMTKHNML